jgi:hypothetical protein
VHELSQGTGNPPVLRLCDGVVRNGEENDEGWRGNSFNSRGASIEHKTCELLNYWETAEGEGLLTQYLAYGLLQQIFVASMNVTSFTPGDT